MQQQHHRLSLAEAGAGGTTVSRRQMLRVSGLGLGSLALEFLANAERTAANEGARKQTVVGLMPRRSHFPQRAKSVILMMQNGGPSQMDLFDPKPELQKRSGMQHSIKVEMFQTGSEQNRLLGSPFTFRKYGRAGIEMSEVIPHLGSVADELCVIRSMHSEHNNHTEALIMFMTGRVFQGRPSFGSWISYALGTENKSLPAYIVLRDPKGYNTSGTLTWSPGWLPALYGGTEFGSEGTPVLNLVPPKGQSADGQRANLEFLASLNRIHQRRFADESELESRIQNYELAARMQLAAGELLDLSGETAETHKLYGLDNPITAPYARRCLLARKLIEAGVRFVQVHPEPFQPWDTHADTKNTLADICRKTDQPAAALIQDLKRRGLLDETVVLWSGEFGRLPVSQNGTGRDHNRNAFTLLAAGGGFKSGYAHGGTDEVGYKSVNSPVSVPDLHATLLHQLGLDHQQLTYHHAGRDETLSDASLTGAHVVEELLA